MPKAAIKTDIPDTLRDACLPDSLPTRLRPTVYAMCGIPAAGKTTFSLNMQQNGIFPGDCFIMDPDRIELLLPGYADTCARLGADAGHALMVAPAREAAYRLQDEAIARRLDILIDMGQALPEALDRLKALKERHGYRLEMYYLYCPVNEAERRARERGRAIEENIIRPRYEALRVLLPLYHVLADRFVALDNADLAAPYRPLYELEGGKLVSGAIQTPPALQDQ